MPDLFWPIFIGVSVLYGLYKWAEHAEKKAQERRQREAQDEARRREAQEKEARWHNYYLQQLTLARQLRRSDQEIQQWAEENYKTILANETRTAGEVHNKLENWAEYLKSKPHGQEVIQFWMEPLKEIRAAKKYVAEGGEYQRRLQERLAHEELQAEVLQFRREFAERFKQDSQSRREQRQAYRHGGERRAHRALIPEVVEPQAQERRHDGILAKVAKALGLRR